MVGEDGAKPGDVLEEPLDGPRRELGEGLVGGGEDREGAGALEGLGEARRLDGGHQGLEGAGGDRGVHQIGLGGGARGSGHEGRGGEQEGQGGNGKTGSHGELQEAAASAGVGWSPNPRKVFNKKTK
jgi:hypothetical protein